MVYKFNEYTRVMDTPNKMLEERAIVEKIMSILNMGKEYSSLESFYEQNKTFDEFKKKNNMDIVLKHFGNKLNQEDYEKIIDSLKKLTEQKISFDDENIKTTSIGENEYVSYTGEDENVYLNNSYSNKSIESQMSDIQKEMENLQTSDIKENTKRIINEMKKDKKIELILRYLNEINYEILNQEQQQLFKFAFDYQKNNNGLIRVDLDEKIMVDNDENMMKIEKIDGEYQITNLDQKYKEKSLNQPEEKSEKKENQLSFKKMPKTQLFEGGKY